MHVAQRSSRLIALIPVILCACASPRVDFALAIHGGAGTIPKDTPAETVAQYKGKLAEALTLGRSILEAGGSSLDAVEQVVRYLEDSPLFNAGKGAVFTNEGTHELDAAVMNGQDLSCGAVSGLKTIKNPIRLARAVMEKSSHVFLVGEGAEAFANDLALERVDQKYFYTKQRYEQWQRKVQEEKADAPLPEGTVGAVAVDRQGNLAAATSTGGLTNKRFGRVGDVPVIGAGTYAKNGSCAVSCTGIGEQFIRHTVARDVAALMEWRGLSLEAAARHVIHDALRPDDGGMIGVSHDGRIALVFNSQGMFRGATDSNGRFEVRIWEEE